MSLYNRYKTDPKLEDEGAWVKWGDGIEFKIRRYRSKVVQDEKRNQERPYEADLKRGRELPEDIAKSLLVEQMCRAIVVDWKGVKVPVQDPENPAEFLLDEKGDVIEEKIEFSVANARRVFSDLPDLMLEILERSMDRDQFKNLGNEDAGKN